MKKLFILFIFCNSFCFSQKGNSKLKFNLCFASANLVTSITLSYIDKQVNEPIFKKLPIRSASNMFAGLTALSFVYIVIRF